MANPTFFYKDDIAKELGDVLWYVAILARDLGYKPRRSCTDEI
jgi:NTP pyrophosphatase (non-canonical NTP hydrolase)